MYDIPRKGRRWLAHRHRAPGEVAQLPRPRFGAMRGNEAGSIGAHLLGHRLPGFELARDIGRKPAGIDQVMRQHPGQAFETPARGEREPRPALHILRAAQGLVEILDPALGIGRQRALFQRFAPEHRLSAPQAPGGAQGAAKQVQPVNDLGQLGAGVIRHGQIRRGASCGGSTLAADMAVEVGGAHAFGGSPKGINPPRSH